MTTIKEWIEALESGRYPKGTGGLCIDGTYCCLGVLSDLDGDLDESDSEYEYETSEVRLMSMTTRDDSWYYGTGETHEFLTSKCDHESEEDTDEATVAGHLAYVNDRAESFEPVIAAITDLYNQWATTKDTP